MTLTTAPMPTQLPTATITGSNNISLATRPTATATMTPNSSATPYTPPRYNADEIIRLLGPPPGSRFAHTAAISFYWQWPLPLSEEQQFNVYLFAEGQATLLGTINKPNVGDSYHLQVTLENMAITAETIHWFVQLETTQHNQPLRMSEARELTISTFAFLP